MPRYVILFHETPAGFERPTHWDLMLEFEGRLATWALAEEPAPGKAIAAEKLADHRLAYLDYEGPVTGGRGNVSRWDAGEYTPHNMEPGSWVLTLTGGKLNGELMLERDGERDRHWTASLE